MPNFTQESTTTEVAQVLASHISGKVILITGCSPNGLGATAAVAIAKHDPDLIILTGRNRALIEETKASILSEAPNVNIKLLIFDLANLKSVRDAAKELNGYDENIDVFINNAGIMAVPYQKTMDDIESHFAVNHIGPFLFTMLTIGKLNQGARIVNISSGGYAFGGVRYEDPNFEVCSLFPCLCYEMADQLVRSI
jgi:NAD(P)-dependent dehydrogenase (short-subunit alcohol dehydrogenase family)